MKVDDSGIPTLSSTTYVSVSVHEATLHPPEVVTPRNFTLVAYEDTFPGGIIGHVIAVDPDGDSLIFHMQSPHLQTMFRYGTLHPVTELSVTYRNISTSLEY